MSRRRGGGSGLLLVAAFVAVFAAEPVATLQVLWQLFRAVGEFGGSLVVELAAGDGGLWS
jgi:hypothetical protein